MINYAEKWKQQMIASREGVENYYESNERAENYAISKAIVEDGEKRALSFSLTKETTILDIGSGPGILAIPLARRSKKVTVVEPSSAMLLHLKKRQDQEGLNNIDVINKRWEDVDLNLLEQHDIVIASYSLNMLDIEEALFKMNRIARKMVYLYWFAGTATWEKIKHDLYPLIKGQSFIGSPKSDLLYGVLYRLGFFPNVRLLKSTSFCYEYNSMFEAIENLKFRLVISNDNYNDLLEDYIINNYKKTGNNWLFVDKTNYLELSWQPVAENTNSNYRFVSEGFTC